MTPAVIEPTTFRFVAQHLNHCATAQEIVVPYKVNKCTIEVSEMYLLYTLYAISINISILQQDCLYSHTLTSHTSNLHLI